MPNSKNFCLSKKIAEDDFFKAQIEQIYIRNNEAELVPRVGRHTIKFGKIEAIENKLTKLKYFYKNKINQHGWKKYKAINLKFKHQVIGEKYN